MILRVFLFSFVFVFLKNCSYGQISFNGFFPLVTINDSAIDLDTSANAVFICIGESFCHQCIESLYTKFESLQKQDTSINIYLLYITEIPVLQKKYMLNYLRSLTHPDTKVCFTKNYSFFKEDSFNQSPFILLQYNIDYYLFYYQDIFNNFPIGDGIKSSFNKKIKKVINY
jgi:hypothetical protein